MRGPKPFEGDILKLGRYAYTGSGARPSAVYANLRQSKMVRLALEEFRPTSILDIGCGDGTYTAEFLEIEYVQSILGIDLNKSAISVAKKQFVGDSRLIFDSASVQEVAKVGKKFDVVVLRGVLHHLENPEQMISLISSISTQVVILEPNGWNPILKIIEKVNPYHRAHGERSFTSLKLQKWLRSVGFQIESLDFAILVPYFFPTFLISIFNNLERIVLKTPYINRLLLGTQVISAKLI